MSDTCLDLCPPRATFYSFSPTNYHTGNNNIQDGNSVAERRLSRPSSVIKSEFASSDGLHDALGFAKGLLGGADTRVGSISDNSRCKKQGSSSLNLENSAAASAVFDTTLYTQATLSADTSHTGDE